MGANDGMEFQKKHSDLNIAVGGVKSRIFKRMALMQKWAQKLNVRVD
jgi:hypothetical protein